jgi:hypothetical protein
LSPSPYAPLGQSWSQEAKCFQTLLASTDSAMVDNADELENLTAL